MHDILDLDTYPLDKPDSPEWHALVRRCRAELNTEGMFNLEGLMPPRIARAQAADLQGLFASESFRHEREHNIYFLKSIPGLAPDHPALTRFQTSNFTLCTDQVAGTALMRLYEWPQFAAFLAAVMDKPQLFIMDDPLAGLNVMSYGAGQALNWHFDRSEFTVTLLLQAADQGGAFEYRSDLRSEDDPNYNGVAQLLTGQDTELRRMSVEPGTLNVFRGKNTAHRVTPVRGNTARVIAVLSYYETPGIAFTDSERMGFFGRTG